MDLDKSPRCQLQVKYAMHCSFVLFSVAAIKSSVSISIFNSLESRNIKYYKNYSDAKLFAIKATFTVHHFSNPFILGQIHIKGKFL